MSNATLPRSIEIDSVMHVECFRGQNFVIFQNYTAQRATSDQPLVDRTPQIIGSSRFYLYEITHNPGEELGQLLFTGTSVIACQDFAARSGLS